jgi:hypothetical protein
MKVYVNGLWFDSDIEPIVIKFRDSKDAHFIGQLLVDMPEPNRNFIAYPNEMPPQMIETIINITKSQRRK